MVDERLKVPRAVRTAMILTCLFIAVSFGAGPASTQVTTNNPQKIELIDGRQAVANEVLVKFRNPTADSIAQAEQDEDVDSDAEIGGIGVRLFHSRSKDVATLLASLKARPDVVYVEPNYIIHADLTTPNDPSFSSLWGLRNTGQVIGGQAGTPGADISAASAWDITTGSRANVVAVVDTGIDYNHPDLFANVWSAPTAFTVTIGTQTISCAAGTHGFNAITNTCDPLDDNNHGSHCSGTIGGVGNNGVGVAGVNWTASIMGVKFLNSGGSGSTANAVNAIEFTIQAKQIFGAGANVRVLSNSWGGGGFSQALLDEINRANTNNMLFVAAAGNNGSNNDASPFYPASYNAPNVVAVAATDNRDQKASFSNYGSTTVDLGAPGVNILSTTMGNSYSFFSGTSMATPHVSGAAALVLSVCSLDTAALKSNLLNNVDPIPALSGITVTGGRLNVNKALLACGAPTPDFSLSASPASQTVAPGASTTYNVTVTQSGGFSGTVTFSPSGLPAGAGADFSPPSVNGSGSSTMTVTTSGATPPGSYTLTITGTSGSLVHSTSVTLVVSGVTPDFSLSAAPSSQTVVRRASTTYTVTVTPSGGFGGTVTFSVSGLTGGATASFNPTSVNTSGSSTMTIDAGNKTGTFTLTITGMSGNLQHSTAVTLVVTR